MLARMSISTVGGKRDFGGNLSGGFEHEQVRLGSGAGRIHTNKSFSPDQLSSARAITKYALLSDTQQT